MFLTQKHETLQSQGKTSLRQPLHKGTPHPPESH